MNEPQFVLEYWNIRGTTQALRNLLEFLQVDYQDKTIQWPTNITYNFKIMIDYPKMPNLKHGNFECTQIVPIGKYLCRINNRNDLLGKTLRDEVTIDSFILELFSVRKTFLDAMAVADKQSSQYSQIMTSQLTGLKNTFLKKLSQHLQINQWYMGNYLSLVDFFLYNLLFYFQGFAPSVIDQSIDNYMTRYENIQQIRKYLKSGRDLHPVSLSQVVNQKWTGKRSFK